MIYDLKFVWYKINYFYFVVRLLMMVCFISCIRLLLLFFGVICCFRIFMFGWIKDMVGCLLLYIRVVSVFIGFKIRINFFVVLRLLLYNVIIFFRFFFIFLDRGVVNIVGCCLIYLLNI